MSKPLTSEIGLHMVYSARIDAISSNAPGSGRQQLGNHDTPGTTKGFRNFLTRESIAFFLLGTLCGLPCMTITSSAKVMFQGVTGAYGLCAFMTAALTSFVAPMFAHHIPFSYRTILLTMTSFAALGICTAGSNKVGPVIGTMLGGATYAFGSSTYLAVAASFPQYTVVSFSSGCGFSVVLGPVLYIALMVPLQQAWRKVLLVCLCFPAMLCVVWWVLLDEAGLREAERVRMLAVTKGGTLECGSTDSFCLPDRSQESIPVSEETKPGFGTGISRTRLFFRLILPRYVVPLFLCTTGAVTCLLGLSPTFQNLGLFQASPKGDMQFEIYYLTYGTGQFLGALLSMKVRMTFIWGWACLQIAIVVTGIVQLFHPFLKYYPIWAVFMFTVGICVGGAVTNTNYKIADDFRRQNQPEEVRSYAMSYGGTGNFAGDALGGCLAIMIEVLAKKH